MTEANLRAALRRNRHLRGRLAIEHVGATLPGWPDDAYEVRGPELLPTATGLLELKVVRSGWERLGLTPLQADRLRRLWAGGTRAWVLAQVGDEGIALWPGSIAMLLVYQPCLEVPRWFGPARILAGAAETFLGTLTARPEQPLRGDPQRVER